MVKMNFQERIKFLLKKYDEPKFGLQPHPNWQQTFIDEFDSLRNFAQGEVSCV
jgi:hypothetical protein